jgi:hypothetical protein
MNVYRVTATAGTDKGSIIVTGKDETEAIALAKNYIPVRYDVRDSAVWSAELLTEQSKGL